MQAFFKKLLENQAREREALEGTCEPSGWSFWTKLLPGSCPRSEILSQLHACSCCRCRCPCRRLLLQPDAPVWAGARIRTDRDSCQPAERSKNDTVRKGMVKSIKCKIN